MKTAGILFAAGKWTRLAPLTDTCPKPLLIVNNTSLLERNIHLLSKKVDVIVIVVWYLQEKIRNAIGEKYQETPIIYAEQKNPNGTLDAFRIATKNLPLKEKYNYIVMNGDDIYAPSFFSLLEEKITNNPDIAHILAQENHDKDFLKKFGIIETEGNLYKKIHEKPQEYISPFVNIGLYYFPEKISHYIPEKKIIKGEEYITSHLIDPYNEKNTIEVLFHDGIWLPVNTPKQYEKTKKICTEKNL